MRALNALRLAICAPVVGACVVVMMLCVIREGAALSFALLGSRASGNVRMQHFVREVL